MKVYDVCYEEYKWAKTLQIADVAGSLKEWIRDGYGYNWARSLQEAHLTGALKRVKSQESGGIFGRSQE